MEVDMRSESPESLVRIERAFSRRDEPWLGG